MNRWLTSRLAARSGTRAAELIVHADLAGAAVRRVIDQHQQQLLLNLRDGQIHHTENYRHALIVLQGLPAAIWLAMRAELARLLLWSHNHAADSLLATLPRSYLHAAMNTRRQRPARLLEHSPGPSAIQFGVEHVDGVPTFTTQAKAPTMSIAEESERWRELLFPPPDEASVRKILDRLLGHRPPEFIGTSTVISTPRSLAADIAQRYAIGETTADVARFIRPYFIGSYARADRTARTLGAYIGSERNLATSEALGDMVIGYQVHNAGGENARHAHALRSGTVYYKEPKVGQTSIDVMPHPPQDTQRGPHDDMKAPHGLCYNCRCWVTPVLAPLPAMSTPAFVDNADRLIPDPAHFADWFEQATPQQQRAAAGTRRIATAEKLLGRAPTWADMVDPDSGQLVSLDQLKGETPEERAARAGKVHAVILRNRDLLQQAAALGTV